MRNKTQRNVYSIPFILIISVVLWNDELFRHECAFGIVNNTLFISILIKIGMNMRLSILCNIRVGVVNLSIGDHMSEI